MSKFFRSGDSTSSSGTDSGSSSSSEDDDAQNVSDSTELSRPMATRTPSMGLSNHRDLLLHALLEERCLNQAREHLPEQEAESAEVKAEGRRRYRRLCGQLAPYNLISSGLDGDQHAPMRQRYRNGLDILSQQTNSNTVAPTLRRMITEGDASSALWPASSTRIGPDTSLGRPSLPYPLRRLLTGLGQVGLQDDTATAPLGPTIDLPSQDLAPRMLPESRYRNEFVELKPLGRGGYGVVYQVRHRLDNQLYAIKKVPISPQKLQRIQRTGQTELEKVLREVQTLAKLDHPNIVRYYNGWVEWIDGTPRTEHVVADSSVFDSEPSDAVAGAASDDAPIRRIHTESSVELGDVLFEHSNTRSAIDDNSKDDMPLQRVSTRSTTATVTDETIESIDRTIDPSYSMQSAASGIMFTGPTLALHMQMSLHPTTLADFLAPSPPASNRTPPLSHCYHLDSSVNLLLVILDGLDYLHHQGIIHRDIKPANIFLGAHSNPRATAGSVDSLLCNECRAQHTANPVRLEVRIGDFGLVSVAGPEVETDAENDSREVGDDDAASAISQRRDTTEVGPATQPAKAVGTTIYRPSNPQTTGPGLDIYALGIVAFELLYRFKTKMGRLDDIRDLKNGQFPDGFCASVGSDRAEKVKKCIMSMLDSGSNGTSVRNVRKMVAALDSVH